MPRPPIANPPSGSAAGVTLTELLVALVVLSAASLLVVAGLGAGRQVWAGVDRTAGALEGVENAQASLRTLLSEAAPMPEPIGLRTMAFTGRPNRLDFTAYSLDGGRRVAGWQITKVWLTPDGTLQLDQHSDIWSIRLNAPVRRTALVRGVQALDIQYYGPTPDGGLAGWQTVWRNQPRLPQAIRVQVRFPPGDPRIWPDLVVRPGSDTVASCAMDFTERACWRLLSAQ